MKFGGNGTFVIVGWAIRFEVTFTSAVECCYVTPLLVKDIVEDDNIHYFDAQRTNEIDFTEDIRDALLLAIPMKILHSPDCKGVELADKEIVIDGRLASLGGLLERLREEEMNSDAPGGVSQG